MRRLRDTLEDTSSSAAVSATLRIREAAHPTVSATSGTQTRLLSANIDQRGQCRGRFRNPLGLDTSDGHESLLGTARYRLTGFANPMRIIVNCTKKKIYTSVDVQGDRLGLDCTLLCALWLIFFINFGSLGRNSERNFLGCPYGDTGWPRGWSQELNGSVRYWPGMR